MSLWMRTYADWHCRNTQLGTSLRGRFDGGSLHEDIDQSFRDAFRMKASSTLQKRASSMTRLAKLLREAGQLYPLRLSEPELYSALCNMRAAGAGATAAQHIIEALHLLMLLPNCWLQTFHMWCQHVAVVLPETCSWVRTRYVRSSP